jgi:hypothetical protein
MGDDVAQVSLGEKRDPRRWGDELRLLLYIPWKS